MSQVESLLDTRPLLHRDVVLGPVVASGTGYVHHLKDRRTGRFFQVGVREFFLISRLDGRRTLAAIGEDYRRRFHRRLDEQRWRRLLELLTRRGLLAGTEVPGVSAERDRRTVFSAIVPLANPDALLARIEPRLRVLFARWFAMPALVAALVVLGYSAANVTELAADARRLSDDPVGIATVVVVYCLAMAVHECAHGLACKRYGGSVPEIGIMWRFPILALYCETGDVVVFGNRWHRVQVAFAGVFSTMVLAVPFGVLWFLTPAGGDTRAVAAALLLFAGYSTMFNLVPVFRLDGYFMLNHALDIQNLRVESYRYLRTRLRRGRREVRDYPRRQARIYALYGTFSVLASVALAVLGGWWVYAALRPVLGAVPAGAAVAGVACAVAVGALIARRRATTGG